MSRLPEEEQQQKLKTIINSSFLISMVSSLILLQAFSNINFLTHLRERI
jgi:hypothetical protein